MKYKTQIILALFAAFALLTGCSDQDNTQAKLDASLPVISMADLVKQGEQYKGKTITVTGRFGGMCADGADFYFKDKLDLIEVIPPASGLPSDIILGTPLKIQGVVMVRGEHKEADENHEEGEMEPDVKIHATVIQTNRS
jgi:hypothetical protein